MIRKLKKEELPEVLPVSKGRNTLLRVLLLELEVGEGLFLPREDWKAKRTPSYVVAAIKRTHKRAFEYGFKTDGSGWLFRRVR